MELALYDSAVNWLAIGCVAGLCALGVAVLPWSEGEIHRVWAGWAALLQLGRSLCAGVLPAPLHDPAPMRYAGHLLPSSGPGSLPGPSYSLSGLSPDPSPSTPPLPARGFPDGNARFPRAARARGRQVPQ